MAKRSRGFTDKKYGEWVKQGRGFGYGESYKPWITIQDVSSLGNSDRVKSYKTNRQHQFLSNHERFYFYILEYADKVIDIREQYPLLYRETTEDIADELGIIHPKDPTTKVNTVLTTDFLITIMEDGESKDIARTIKQVDDYQNRRTIEKFEIERVYWERKNVDWKMVSEIEINSTFAQNLQRLRGFYNINNHLGLENIDSINLNRILYSLKDYILSTGDDTVRNIIQKFEDRFSLEYGLGLTLFNHLLYTKQISMDIESKLLNYDDIYIFDIDNGHCLKEVQA